MSTPTWVPVVTSIFGLIGALLVVSLNIRHTARAARANLFSAYRLKWMDLFREQLSELLILGERCYDPSLQANSPDQVVISELRATGTRLIILLGRDRDKRIRKDFAELVRRFKAEPTAALSEILEIEAQNVFLDAWRRGRADTGKPTRRERPPGQVRVSAAPTGAEIERGSNAGEREEGASGIA